jgi:cyclopropane-fatty-acyl-phospholipid synthase
MRDAEGQYHFGPAADSELQGDVQVHRPRFYTALTLGGGLAAAESYLRGDWDCEDLTTSLRLFARNAEVLSAVDRWGARLMAPGRSLWMWTRRNTRAGSRRNIAAHYDLSNEFFALMLDPTMTYSSGWFERPEATLQEASVAKYERICRKLDLQPSDHVVEIGCGWGGFALHAARQYGCRVTATTISQQQYAEAERRVERAGLQDRIELKLTDYRDLRGQYDKLVSIEMIEAVGEKMFDTYFRQCNRLLKPDGAMLLQAITMPDDRYDYYRRSVDFINRYVFPGGFLPSFSAIGQSLRRATDFRVVHSEDFAADYARTLAAWRANFWAKIAQVRQLGFDERFIRTWHYYLCYCQAGFAEDQIGVSQMMFTRPRCTLRVG